MRRRILLPAMLATLSVSTGVASAASTMRVQNSRGLAPRLAGATDVGALAPRTLSVTLVLAPRKQNDLRALLARPHTGLTRAAFAARFRPASTTVLAIRKWAAAHGLRIHSVSSNRLLVRLAGSSTALGRAFRVRFDAFRAPHGARFFSTNRKARLPASFARAISAVLGLSDLGRLVVPRPSRRHAALPPLAIPTSYGPQGFWSLYNAPATQTGTGQSLAIITEGDVSQPRKDLVTFEQKFGLPAVTWNQINVGTASSDTSGNDEWDLDSQYSTGFAPGVAKLNVYVGTSLSNQDILATINRWVTDDIAKQGSFSAGECELLANVSGFSAGLDAVLSQAAAQGQTMFVSSGDTGSQCPAVIGVNGVPAGIVGVSYPASSPFGIGVGGTTVLGSNPTTEIGWYAGGGGASALEPVPAFQSKVAVGGAAPLATRGVPDVSLDADPNSGYQVVVGGTVQTIGGTSASAPSWQGIWARAQGAHSGLGFAGPVIYAEPALGFHDITIGGNGLYTALPGYDYVTGRGTPDIAAFVGAA